MQAITLSNGNLTYRTDYPTPDPAPGEALIRINLAGICATDLEIIKGYAGFQGILGHEFVGTVEQSPDPAWAGRRVVATINLGCNTCQQCLSNGPEHCPRRTVLGIINRDGAFADYVTLPLANLIPVPDDVPDEAAVFTEPLAAALRIREQIPIRPSQQAAVVGPGRLGLLIGQVLALSGTQLTMLGRTQSSLALPRQLGLSTALVDTLPDNHFNLVVEATGNDQGLAHALRLVRPLGTLVMKSTFAVPATIDLTKLVVAEITIIGSRCGPFGPALRLLARDAIQVHPLIDAEYPLRDAEIAFEHASRPGVRKVLLRP